LHPHSPDGPYLHGFKGAAHFGGHGSGSGCGHTGGGHALHGCGTGAQGGGHAFATCLGAQGCGGQYSGSILEGEQLRITGGGHSR